jgi:putative FmdB family regulatory protein
MPIYEFKCSNCGEVCELIMKMGADIPPCKACGWNTLNKVPCKVGFTIEGCCAANGYETAGNIPDVHYDPGVGPKTWDD